MQDKKIVITGGATGMARASALLCAEHGAKIVIGDINVTEGKSTVSDIQKSGGEAWFYQTDVSNEEQMRSLIENAARHMGGITSLVSAAAIARDSLVPVDEFLTSTWEQHIDINLTGSFLAAKYAVPYLRKAGGGVIVMIASGAGVRGGSSIVAYGASKGGVNGLGMTLEQALAGDNIRVNVLCPGNIATPLKLGIIDQQVERVGEDANETTQIAGLGTPDGMAKVIRFLLSDDADYIRGAIFTR
jgi:NAD(P)-dependent dehydrogenase (short-subunit alcohol dehydrogenase family)